jgi:hypothetical protein
MDHGVLVRAPAVRPSASLAGGPFDGHVGVIRSPTSNRPRRASVRSTGSFEPRLFSCGLSRYGTNVNQWNSLLPRVVCLTGELTSELPEGQHGQPRRVDPAGVPAAR